MSWFFNYFHMKYFKIWYKGICYFNNIVLGLLPALFSKQKLERDFISTFQIFAKKLVFSQHTCNNFILLLCLYYCYYINYVSATVRYNNMLQICICFFYVYFKIKKYFISCSCQSCKLSTALVILIHLIDWSFATG